MRKARVNYDGVFAGVLTETDQGEYVFQYDEEYVKMYENQFITFNMPVRKHPYSSKILFPFFDGLIPEGWMLQIASESWRIPKNDRMGLLLACCANAIGAVSIHPFEQEL